MGRAMLIVVAGVLVAMGFMSIGASQQSLRISVSNAGYAQRVHSKNSALTAIQIAMNNINADPDWDANNATPDDPWSPTIEGANIKLYVEDIAVGAGPMDPDTIRIVSQATYFGQQAQVVSLYEKQALHYVPQFKSAISFATNQFNFSMSGSSSISGMDQTGQCTDAPGISVMDNTGYQKVAAYDGSGNDSGGGGNGNGNGKGGGGGSGNAKGVSGNPAIDIDSELSYHPVDELIARLETMPGVQHLNGNYKGDMGSQSNPGVYFVDQQTKLTGGINEGYGIMVIRTNGSLQYEGSLNVAGNFKFNGLVVFENAWNLDGKGTPRINGSVLVGNTQNTTDLNVDINGNIHFQFDCTAEIYAQLAAANLLNQNRYSRLTSFE